MHVPARLGRAGLALLSGCLVAWSLPPFGWWPLGILGTAALAGLLAGQRCGSRLLVGLLAGLGQLGIGLAWAGLFSLAGYLVLVLVESVFLAAAAGCVTPRAGRVPAFVGALVLAEAARDSFPFGGLPLASAALGQAAGPLAILARLGGPLAVLAGLALAGAALAEATLALAPGAARPVEPGRRAAPAPSGWVAPVRGAATAVVVLAGAWFFAAGSSGGPAVGQLSVAAVQGGRLGAPSDIAVATQVLAAQLAATRRLTTHADLVLWPEDVVALDAPFTSSPERRLLVAVARRLHTTLVAGVTEPAGRGHFRNEVVAIGPTGRTAAVFEKVHLVPFGEYVPDRALFAHLADLAAVPLDAVAGHGSGEISTPAGRFAVLISFETFFASRGRSGVLAGGEALLVPTNTASYASSQVPAQELAASRLQAIAEGRDLLQAATVGFTAMIAPNGEVLAHLALDQQGVLAVELPLRRGATPYDRFGEAPLLALAAAAIAAGWALELSGMRRPSSGSEATDAECSTPATTADPGTSTPRESTPSSRVTAPAGTFGALAARSASPSGRSAKSTLLKRMNLPTQITA
jgi:apolipoprotein N-acyltransferase